MICYLLKKKISKYKGYVDIVEEIYDLEKTLNLYWKHFNSFHETTIKPNKNIPEGVKLYMLTMTKLLKENNICINAFTSSVHDLKTQNDIIFNFANNLKFSLSIKKLMTCLYVYKSMTKMLRDMEIEFCKVHSGLIALSDIMDIFFNKFYQNALNEPLTQTEIDSIDKMIQHHLDLSKELSYINSKLEEI